MAAGGAARCTIYYGAVPSESLHQLNAFITFISSSAGWIYPIDRFFGRALYGKWICKIHTGYTASTVGYLTLYGCVLCFRVLL